ncbi:kinase-like protein [Schizopora paradoxa]|uniref:Kinase-like protein n=1 Tax=Schizopora paradoxa TaxID=27342 RepID=A0A0H2RR43_9AGAM|nr:kinase-like protein [Schizopora paradoxa]
MPHEPESKSVPAAASDLLAHTLEKLYNLTKIIDVKTMQQLPSSRHGNFAIILQAMAPEPLGKVAIKVINARCGGLKGQQTRKKDIARELKAWHHLGTHENILKLEGYIEYKNYFAPVSKWIEGGTLWDLIERRRNRNQLDGVQVSKIESNRFDRREALLIINGIASGLAYMHEKGVIHSDVKSGNVLISHENRPLLTDYGCSRIIEATRGYSTSMNMSSIPWKARELCQLKVGARVQTTEQTDVWAFGMTVYEILALDRPYCSMKEVAVPQFVEYIAKGRLPDAPFFSEPGGEDFTMEKYMWFLCNRCWLKNSQSRPLMKKIKDEVNGKCTEFPIVVRAGATTNEELMKTELQISRGSAFSTTFGRVLEPTINWERELGELQLKDLTLHVGHVEGSAFPAQGGTAQVIQGLLCVCDANDHIDHKSRKEPQFRADRVAIKQIFTDRTSFEKRLLHEFRIWSHITAVSSKFECPNILPLLGYTFMNNDLWTIPAMVSEWKGDCTLQYILPEYKRSSALLVSLGIAEGIYFLHSQGIVHGDIKSVSRFTRLATSMSLRKTILNREMFLFPSKPSRY